MSETNLPNCRKQLEVCASFTDYHLRYQLLLKQLPTDSIVKHADAAQAIKDAHSKARPDAEDLSHMAEKLPDMESLKSLLVAAKSCGSSRNPHCGATEQAHRLEKSLNSKEWKTRFSLGKMVLPTHIFRDRGIRTVIS